MPLVIQQWIAFIVMLVLVIAVVSWSATYLGKRSRKAENNIGSENVLPSENTISFKRELQDIDSIDVFTSFQNFTTLEPSGTAVTFETSEKLSTSETLKKSSTLNETESSEVTGIFSSEENTKVSKTIESFTFSTTNCPDTEDHQQDKETSSSLITLQDIQEFTASNYRV